VEERCEEEEEVEWCPEETKYDYHEHMALAAKAFWGNKGKFNKSRDNSRNASSGQRPNGPRARTCYSCGDKYHFVVECPCDKMKDHGGRIIRKDKSKVSLIKNSGNKNFPPKKYTTQLLLWFKSNILSEIKMTSVNVKKWEWMPSPPPPHLFKLSNEKHSTDNHKCIMARETEGYASRGKMVAR
jgi:hypothetical protein